jgi:hypothetical protein
MLSLRSSFLLLRRVIKVPASARFAAASLWKYLAKLYVGKYVCARARKAPPPPIVKKVLNASQNRARGYDIQGRRILLHSCTVEEVYVAPVSFISCHEVFSLYEVVSKSFRTESITKYTPATINTRWEATQRVMAAKLTSDTTAPNGRELCHLQFSLPVASPETFGYTLVHDVHITYSYSRRSHIRPSDQEPG